MSRRTQLILATSSWPIGRHASAWRLPEAFVPHPVDAKYLAETAAAAERGLFDYFFVGNAISSDPDREITWTNDVFKAEGFTLGAFVAAHTSRVGIVVTTNTTYSDPYDTARAALTLEHLSQGRLGLNLVLGLAGIDLPAANYGMSTHPERDIRYERAEEFVAIFRALQHSWGEDWLLKDKATGKLFNREAFHPIHFSGEHLSVDGALNVPPPIQNEIPLIHAGTSERSLAFGADHVAIRFSPYFGTDFNSGYYQTVRQTTKKVGRDPDDVAIVPGVTFYVGGTIREARDKFREVQRLVVSEYASETVSAALGQDVTGVPARERVVDVLDEEALSSSPWLTTAFEAYGDTQITLEDLFQYASNTGHLNQNSVVGDGPYVANWIAERFEARVFDGVKVFPPYSRTPLDAFVDLVVPELQAIGIHRTEYTGQTLSDHLRQSR